MTLDTSFTVKFTGLFSIQQKYKIKRKKQNKHTQHAVINYGFFDLAGIAYNFEENNIYMAKELYLYSPFYPETAEAAVRELNTVTESDELTIRINTPGGSVGDGWAVISKLSERKAEKRGIVDGAAMSMGAMLLLFLDHVVANDTSQIMLHKAAYPSWYEATETEMTKLKVINAKFKEKLEAKIGGKKGGKEIIEKIFESDVRNDVDLTPIEAKKLGIIHEVRQLEPTAYAGKQIVAISEKVNSNNNINIKPKKMGIFGTKAPILLAMIGETQFAYSELKQGEKVKAIGNNDISISGNFEASDNDITVIDNVITAVVPINKEKKRLEALESKVDALIEAFEKPEKEEKKEVDNTAVSALEEKVEKLTGIIAKAKLAVSSPELPVGEFKEDAQAVTLTSQELLSIAQAEAHEAKIKEREGI